MHRDLKPENLLFHSQDSLKRLQIVDFGLAAFEQEYPYIFPKCGKKKNYIFTINYMRLLL